MQIEIYQGSRAELLPLFRLADESESQILSYYELGTVLVAYDGATVVGIAHVVDDDEGYIELVSLAVRPEYQGAGVGTRLIEAAVCHCRENGADRLIVGTGAWETDNIIFYLRRGFRIFNVNRDFFSVAKGYAPSHRDQVQLEIVGIRQSNSEMTASL